MLVLKEKSNMYTFARNTQYLAPKWRAYVTPYGSGFRFANGVTVGSLWELKQALLTLEEDLVMEYISPTNHVSLWVRDVVGDAELAQELEKATQRWGMVVALERQMMRTLNMPEYVAQRWLREAGSPFQFSSGEIIHSIAELEEVLPNLSDETLAFHYLRFPNDLSVWLSDVVGDYYLSDSLEEINTKEQITHIVADHLKMLHEAS